MVHTGETADEITPESSKSVAYTRGSFGNYRAKQKFKSRQSDGCFICGRSHLWRSARIRGAPLAVRRVMSPNTGHPSALRRYMESDAYHENGLWR